MEDIGAGSQLGDFHWDGGKSAGYGEGPVEVSAVKMSITFLCALPSCLRYDS